MSDHRRSGSPILAEVLARHGLPLDVAAKIEAVGMHLRAAHSADGNEHAALLDIDTGERLAPDITGERDKVDLRSHLDAMQPDGTYVQIHSHRPGVTLSLEDFAFLVFFPSIRSMVVVAVDHYWYVLSVLPGANPSPLTEVEEAMWELVFRAPTRLRGSGRGRRARPRRGRRRALG